MGHKQLFLWLAVLCLAGAIAQKVFWGGAMSIGLIIMAAGAAYCSIKAKE